MEPRKERKVMMARGAGNKFDGYCRDSGKYGDKSKTCWATGSTKPSERGHGSKGKESKQVREST